MNKEYISTGCKKDCKLYHTCCHLPTEVVRHKGNKIDVLFCGQGAGKDEERLKRPFVGRAGKYLRNLLMHIWKDYGKFNIALTNNVRFRPYEIKGNKKKNREPTDEEISICKYILLRDIDILNPSVIIPLGKNASQSLIQDSEKLNMTQLRNPTIVNINGIDRSICPTYHPSFLCRKYNELKKDNINMNYNKQVINDIINSLDKRLNDKIPEIF